MVLGIEQLVGDGKNTNFWDGFWAGDKPLKERFPRMYQLCVNKEGKVGEMGEWNNGCWGWKVEWRWELRERERGLGKVNCLIF